ncbi:MAG: hypothetical protein GC189_02250 [Alphaproteobacteria bacterium]|nr:hypothetical protein [Alphaproteobacteria bacterium]
MRGAAEPILVVNGTDTAVRIARGVLAQLGVASVDEASSGRAAIEKLRRKRYRAVVTGGAAAPDVEGAARARGAVVIAAGAGDIAALKRALQDALERL